MTTLDYERVRYVKIESQASNRSTLIKFFISEEALWVPNSVINYALSDFDNLEVAMKRWYIERYRLGRYNVEGTK